MDKAVLLTGYGGPSNRDDVKPFIKEVFHGRPIPTRRVEEVIRQYETGENGLFFPEMAARWAEDFKSQLKTDRPFYMGMLFGKPSLKEALARMAADGIREASALVLSPFATGPMLERYARTIQFHSLGSGPKVKILDAWGEDPAHLFAVAERMKEVVAPWPEVRRNASRWIFTAHSLPVVEGKEYAAALGRAAEALLKSFGRSEGTLAFQSRSGDPSEAWLEPTLENAVAGLSADPGSDVFFIPLGFALDHREVLFDLDGKARALVEKRGFRYHRSRAAGDHPLLVDHLARRIEEFPA